MDECAACKCKSWACLQMTQLQFLMGCHGHHAILRNPNRFIFRDNTNVWYLVVPLKISHPYVIVLWCKVSLISTTPSSPEVCVCGGGQIVIP